MPLSRRSFLTLVASGLQGGPSPYTPRVEEGMGLLVPSRASRVTFPGRDRTEDVLVAPRGLFLGLRP